MLDKCLAFASPLRLSSTSLRTEPWKSLIPAKAGIQTIENLLIPGPPTGVEGRQARNDGNGRFCSSARHCERSEAISLFGAPPRIPGTFCSPKKYQKGLPWKISEALRAGRPPVNRFKLGASRLGHESLLNPAASLRSAEIFEGCSIAAYLKKRSLRALRIVIAKEAKQSRLLRSG
jgi:hypothetical protein